VPDDRGSRLHPAFKEEWMVTLTTAREILGRPIVPLLAIVAVALAACSQVGTSSFTFWDAVYSMIVFFFWVMLIWIFIAIFGDIFRRNDLSGIAKAGWIFLIVVLPFLGALIYIVARPKVTAQDVEMLTRSEAAQQAASAVTPADQIAKLQQLKASGAISDQEYEALKQKALQ
jgi:hypothetical protein